MAHPKDHPRTRFSDWVEQYGAGTLDDRLTAALADVANACQLLDKSGTVTLKLSITAKAGGVVVTPDVKTSPPVSKDGGQFFFVAADGSLSRRDPNQPTLPTMEDTQP